MHQFGHLVFCTVQFSGGKYSLGNVADFVSIVIEGGEFILNSTPDRRKPELEPLWKIKYRHVIFEKHRHISNEEAAAFFNFESLLMVVAEDITDRLTQ